MVFDTLSGDTHLLNLLGFELGLLLQEGPGTKSQLMAAFDNPDTPQTGAELSAGDEFSRALDEQLSRLKLLGLIRAKAV
ncbi:MAG: HPr-rel-A system PqqD family peptide chaperone [Burkholderiaceae bacterium]|nr:HPr-rel-A system PqqD family peptide chaperone [Burkholderiaceae bacterium]